MTQSECGQAKKDGARAAKEWCRSATVQAMIDVAGCRLEYGETLNNLIEDGLEVPHSDDAIFSWGFYKQTKGHVHHVVSTTRDRRSGS